MRQRRNESPEPKTRKAKPAQPLAEGISGRRVRRDWASMSDKELVAYSQRFIGEMGIRTASGLQKLDAGLYRALRKRGLLGGIGLERKRRDWAAMGRDELKAFAERFISERHISTKAGLMGADLGLYQILSKRMLLDEVGLSEAQRDWVSIGTEELKALARHFLAERRITGRKELSGADAGLYQALRKRNLLGEVGLKKKRRDWASMGREELKAFAKRYISDRGVSERQDLLNGHGSLYWILKERKLLGEIGLEEKRRNWAAMDDDELEGYARRFIAERMIWGRSELEKADPGLHAVLAKRKLLDKVGLPNANEGHRDWAAMGREELEALARKYIEAGGIGSRDGLKKADQGLYQTLRKRKLLDGVGLEKKMRHWASMDDHGLESFAKGFIAERGIRGRGELLRADAGLYEICRRRKLLDAVFSDGEAASRKDAVNGVIGALESFGDDS